MLETEGTIGSGAYSSVFSLADIECVTPDETGQKIISDIIYGQIKKGIEPDMDAFLKVAKAQKGCDRIILGCTELSLLMRRGELDRSLFIDPMEILAYSAIRLCGKIPQGFDQALMSFRP